VLAPAGRRASARGEVCVTLAGRPNAGKSSLFNRLVAAERAVVHDTAGTTTDAVTEELSLGPLLLRVADTAGIEAPAEADRRDGQVLVYVLDGSIPAAPWEADAFRAARAEVRILAVAKCDLPPRAGADTLARMEADAVVRTSARTGEGVNALLDTIRRSVEEGRVDLSGELAGAAARRSAALEGALAAAERARGLLAARGDLTLAAVELREALDHVGTLCGRVTTDDILDRIFSEFCIGK